MQARKERRKEGRIPVGGWWGVEVAKLHEGRKKGKDGMRIGAGRVWVALPAIPFAT